MRRNQNQQLETYKAVVHPGEDGYWWAEVPDLTEVVAQAKTFMELRDNLKESIALALSVRRKEEVFSKDINLEIIGG